MYKQRRAESGGRGGARARLKKGEGERDQGEQWSGQTAAFESRGTVMDSEAERAAEQGSRAARGSISALSRPTQSGVHLQRFSFSDSRDSHL